MATAPALAQQSTPAFGGATTVPMSGLRKAAILMVALGDQMAKEIFHTLSPADVRQVVAEIAQLGEVPGHELAYVLAAFSNQLAADQYSLRGGADCANRLLVQAFGPDRAAQTLHEVNVTGNRSRADLSLLQRMEPQQIGRFLENEHPQTIARDVHLVEGLCRAIGPKRLHKQPVGTVRASAKGILVSGELIGECRKNIRQ